jgi:hypothetical protein
MHLCTEEALAPFFDPATRATQRISELLMAPVGMQLQEAIQIGSISVV